MLLIMVLLQPDESRAANCLLLYILPTMLSDTGASLLPALKHGFTNCHLHLN
jgi:hypothetical protein